MNKQLDSKKSETKPELYTVLPAVFQSDKQWAVSQENGMVYLNTLSWTRKESIKKFMSNMDDKLKWAWFKRKYGIHCKKVTVNFLNGW
jgi:hypothetical protein|tara:strand:- start:212 stop:475 length:264 start_codon:yes stop_codon:yes gene_type:complete